MSPIPSMRPEPARDAYGRYLIGGRAYTRATTVVGTLKDLNGLIGWKRRKVAEGLAAKPELLKSVPEMAAAIEACGSDWRSAREAKAVFDSLCDEAADVAGANRGSVAGTQAHTLTEYADAGRLDEVRHLATESELRDLQAYLDACDEHGIERPPQYIERIVINTQVDSAGTLDRLVRLRDGRLVVADVKSQQSVDFGFMEICAQLAQYANADGMLHPDTGELEPMPADLDKTRGIVMHAPVGSGRCDIYEIDLVSGWHAALDVAHELRQLRKRSKVLGWRYTPPRQEPGDRTLFLIRNAPHVDALKALYRDVHARGAWTDEYTQAAAARKAQLVAAD